MALTSASGQNSFKLPEIKWSLDSKLIWIHNPGFFQSVDFNTLLTKAEQLCMVSTRSYYSKTRLSCVLTDWTSAPYDHLPTFRWTKFPEVDTIRQALIGYFNFSPDYVLIHIYPDGNSSISYHNDKEALGSTPDKDTDIYSASFGQARRFLFRPIGQTSGKSAEFSLGHGDLFIMKDQRHFEHHVPKETTVDKPRINLTFRQKPQ